MYRRQRQNRRVISPRRGPVPVVPMVRQVEKSDSLPHHPIIFLIISSSDVPQYAKFRECATRYYSMFSSFVNYFFLECDPHLDTEVKVVDNHYLYVRGHDSIIPGIFDKTLHGLRYIDSNYSYDLLIRTNLSTFWDLHRVLEWKENVPRKFPYAGGFLIFNDFISGTGIILSPEAVDVLLQPSSMATMGRINSHDDVLITRILQSAHIPLQPVKGYHMQYLIDGDINATSNMEKNEPILYYRIRNANRDVDVHHFRFLMNSVYGLEDSDS